MTKEQEEIVNRELIVLDIKDVMELTGWCKQVTQRVFTKDKDFPAIKKGKKYQVSLNGLKEYFSKRRTNK